MIIKANAIARIIDLVWSDIVRDYNSYQVRTLNAIRRCRTPALGGHLYRCNHCLAFHKRYNSCRNRHCPQCQHTQKQQWIVKQESKFINTHYYHIVFTIPHHLNEIALSFPRFFYSSLLRNAWDTLNDFGWNHKYLGEQLGATIILHTWDPIYLFILIAIVLFQAVVYLSMVNGKMPKVVVNSYFL